MNDTCPVLVGGGQITQKDVDPIEALGPIDLMEQAARRAAEDAEVSDAIWNRIDAVRMVNFLSGSYPDPAGLLSERLGIAPQEKSLSITGGNTPQLLVNAAAEDLAAGRAGAVLLAGAETLASLVAGLTTGQVPKWVERDGADPTIVVSDYVGTADYEIPYNFQRPINVYPLFENAYRAHRGWTLDEHRAKLGTLCSAMSAVAAKNPYAWFPVEHSAADIATPSEKNRYVGYPYTKLMNAMIRIDQGAALILTTAGTARELGIPEARRVYLHGCADAKDHWYVSERDNLYSSPAIRVAGEKAFGMAGWSAADLDFIDLYSCFPSAVEIGRDALGLPEDDPRGVTVTGGLPYAGGPANNYVMHSIATMMTKLREKPGSRGLCTALGWYITKHAAGLYSTEPVEGDWRRDDPERYQEAIDRLPKVDVAVEAEGDGVVESYTVIHGHDGPETGIVVGRLEDQRRFLATTPNDPDVFNEMLSVECVGRRGTVSSSDGTNQFVFA